MGVCKLDKNVPFLGSIRVAARRNENSRQPREKHFDLAPVDSATDTQAQGSTC